MCTHRINCNRLSGCAACLGSSSGGSDARCATANLEQEGIIQDQAARCTEHTTCFWNQEEGRSTLLASVGSVGSHGGSCRRGGSAVPKNQQSSCCHN